MSREATHLAEELEAFFGSSAQPWFEPFVLAIDGLDAREAATSPAPRMNSAWAIVNHVTLWHEIVLARLRGEPTDPEMARESGWTKRAWGDETAWRTARQRLTTLNADLAAVVRAVADDALERPWTEGHGTAYQLVLGLMNHTSYHTAEIACGRQLRGTWRT